MDAAQLIHSLGLNEKDPMITYANDTSEWEDWQRDYRLGLILIMPPVDVAKQIDALREEHDPRSHAICPTHISVSDPLRREMTSAFIGEIQMILAGIEPFTLYYDQPHASPDHAGVAYPITPQEPIDELKNSLHQASVFEGEVYQRRDIPAHMTIAEFITIDDSHKLCSALRPTAPSGSFLCDRLEFIVPDERFRFQRTRIFYLSDTSTP